ncbi:MAG TPA: type I methionyl aminopeptidase [Bacteroidota bacterium]|nr:type I methionyl aminopeptidase [Bacteroidota bacterium]
MKATIKTRQEIEWMRESCRIVAEVLRVLKGMIKPGVTTKELDALAEEFIRSQGGVPVFKGYGFHEDNLYPASICTSIDDQVVHGIPGNRKLADGEIISVDVGVKKNSYCGDGAWTFTVGTVSEDKSRLMAVTEEALYKGLEYATAGQRVHDISFAVQEHVEEAGYSVVRDLVGHGIGRNLHEDPAVPNFGERGTGSKLKAGMTIAVEPMVNMGKYYVVTEDDGWTVRTKDGSPSAHFEHTVLITENGPEILTK